MEAAERLAARQIGTRISALLGNINEVDMVGSYGATVLPDLHPTQRTGTIVVYGENELDHAKDVGLDALAGHVAEARSCKATATPATSEAPIGPSFVAFI